MNAHCSLEALRKGSKTEGLMEKLFDVDAFLEKVRSQLRRTGNAHYLKFEDASPLKFVRH